MSTKEQDIVDFRKAIEQAFGERIDILKEELTRVRIISSHCKEWFEKYYNWQPPADNTSPAALGNGVVGRVDSNRFEREIYAFGKRVPAIRVASSQRRVDVKELFPARIQALLRFIGAAEKFISGASSYIVPHALVQYTISKYEMRDWTGPQGLAKAYCYRLLNPTKQATFLLDLNSADRALSSRLLSILSRIIGTTSVYQSVCDGNSEVLEQQLSTKDQASLLCAQEISSWMGALCVTDIRALDNLKETLQSIQENFFLHPEIPVLDNEDCDIWTTVLYTDWPETTWGNDEQVEKIINSIICGSGNDDKLEIAAKQGETETSPKKTNFDGTRFDYKEPESDADGHYPYLPGLKPKLHYLATVKEIIQIAIDAKLFNSEDKDVLLYVFTGHNQEGSNYQGRQVQLKDRTAGSGRNMGNITYPYEFVYLIFHMFENDKVIFKLSMLHPFFRSDPDTWNKLQDIFYDDKMQSKKGKIGAAQIAQSAQLPFQKELNRLAPDIFPVKTK